MIFKTNAFRCIAKTARWCHSAASYEGLIEVWKGVEGVLEGGNASAVLKLLSAPSVKGVPARYQEVTNHTRVILVDEQLALFIASLGDPHPSQPRLNSTETISAGLTMFIGAAKAGHIVGTQSHLALMRHCWEANTDEARTLLIDVYHNLVAQQTAYLANRFELGANEGLVNYAPNIDVWVLVIKAYTRMSPVPTQKLRKILEKVTKEANVSQSLQRKPHLWDALYIGWQVVDSVIADKVFMRALHHNSVNEASWHAYMSHAGSCGNALRILRMKERRGVTSNLQSYNSVLLAGLHGAKRDANNAIYAKEVLSMMHTVSLAPSSDTLGIVASLHRREHLGKAGYDMVMGLSEKYGVALTRSCLTSLIAAQIEGCATDTTAVDRAEQCMLQIFERNLLEARPHQTAYHCFGRLMQCYAQAGEVAKLEALRDSFHVRVATSAFEDSTARLTQVMKNAHTDAFKTAALRAQKQMVDWGGNANTPWKQAESVDPSCYEADVWP